MLPRPEQREQPHRQRHRHAAVEARRREEVQAVRPPALQVEEADADEEQRREADHRELVIRERGELRGQVALVVHQDPHGISAPLALRQPTRIESETGNSGQIPLPDFGFRTEASEVAASAPRSRRRSAVQ